MFPERLEIGFRKFTVGVRLSFESITICNQFNGLLKRKCGSPCPAVQQGDNPREAISLYRMFCSCRCHRFCFTRMHVCLL